MHRPALLLAIALIASSCGDNPASPSDGPLFSGPYTLDVTPAQACSTILPERWLPAVQFRMVPADLGGTWRFSLPTAQVDASNPAGSSGDLSIEITVSGMQAAGTMGGWGLASDASRTLAVRAGETDLGRARVSGSLTGGCPATVYGVINGVLSFGTWGLSVGAQCLAASHSFQLRAQPT